MPDNQLHRRLKALIIFRVFLSTLLLGTLLVVDISGEKFTYRHTIPYIIIPLYFISIIYALLLNRIKNHTVFAYFQVIIDGIFSVFIISLTGGVNSWFSSLMLLTVIASVFVIGRKAGYIQASLCSILYGCILDLQYYGIALFPYETDIEAKAFLFNIFSHAIALYTTAFLTGSLSSRLEKTAQKLKETDSDLRDLALFQQELLESLPSGLLTINPNGSILIFNRAAEQITTIPRHRALEINICDIFPFITLPLTNQRSEGAIIVKGEERVIGLGLSDTMDASGEKTGYICIFQDITDLKNLEAELKHKETLAAIGALSANIAHEIRNPLASLKGAIEMLKEGVLTNEHRLKLMNIALSEMDRLNKIITDFLTYSRPRELEFSHFDLHFILDETIELMKSAAGFSNNVIIKKDFRGINKISADQQKMRQVFLNIGLNAVESLHGGGEISISTRNEKGFAIVSIRDTGTGIAREHLKEIFYPFFTTKEQGTGLGLSIAHRIIEEHSGKITLKSSPGIGSTFEVFIPLHQPVHPRTRNAVFSAALSP